jgi:hypothetical protein
MLTINDYQRMISEVTAEMVLCQTTMYQDNEKKLGIHLEYKYQEKIGLILAMAELKKNACKPNN